MSANIPSSGFVVENSPHSFGVATGQQSVPATIFLVSKEEALALTFEGNHEILIGLEIAPRGTGGIPPN